MSRSVASVMEFYRKNTGVGCHSLLQGIFLTQEHVTPALQADPLLSEPPGRRKASLCLTAFRPLGWVLGKGIRLGFRGPLGNIQQESEAFLGFLVDQERKVMCTSI